jgi:hypothetical protein
MKPLIFITVLMLILFDLNAQECDGCAGPTLSFIRPQSPDCSSGVIIGAGETCTSDCCVEFTIKNLETGEIVPGPYFGGVGGRNCTNLTGNQFHSLKTLSNGLYEITATITSGPCANREQIITADLRRIEVCDGKDNDCDGAVDEGVKPKFYRDEDGDGFGGDEYAYACGRPVGYVTNSDDCDDSEQLYPDIDGDGYGRKNSDPVACGGVRNDNDCNDDNPDIRPNQKEICDNLDNDCDGEIDEGFEFRKMTYYYDQDGDGYGDRLRTTRKYCDPPSSKWVESGTDCNDNDPEINPGKPELCNGKDDDCFGGIDNIGIELKVENEYICNTGDMATMTIFRTRGSHLLLPGESPDYRADFPDGTYFRWFWKSNKNIGIEWKEFTHYGRVENTTTEGFYHAVVTVPAEPNTPPKSCIIRSNSVIIEDVRPQKPSIVSDLDHLICPNQTGKLELEPGYNPIFVRFQWYKDGIKLPEVGPELVISGSDNPTGSYAVEVIGATTKCSVKSEPYKIAMKKDVHCR